MRNRRHLIEDGGGDLEGWGEGLGIYELAKQ
jgi:hypothetical protein